MLCLVRALRCKVLRSILTPMAGNLLPECVLAEENMRGAGIRPQHGKAAPFPRLPLMFALEAKKLN